MKKIGCILLFLTCILSAKANITLVGTTFDKTHQENLPYVNISLYPISPAPAAVADTSILIDATLSNETGKFELQVPKTGSYLLKASFIGYKTKQKRIEVTETTNPQNIGRVPLKEEEQLIQEVEVTGQKSSVRLELDKKVFHVEQDLTSVGASASELLENIPSVDVDEEGNVFLRNKSNVEIWMNGKPSGISSSDKGQILEMIPAESVERIELITNPSAKYNPEGSVGIINIVLKKNRKAGYYGGASASVRYHESAPYPGGKLGVNFSYNSPKWEAYIDGSGRANFRQKDSYNHRTSWTAPGDSTFLNEDKTRFNQRYSGFLQTGFTYHISPVDELSLNAYGMYGKSLRNSENQYEYFNQEHISTESRVQTILSEGDKAFYNARLDYLHQFEKDKHEISANLSYFGDYSLENKEYEHLIYVPTPSSSAEKQRTEGLNHHASGQVDYFKHWKRAGKLEAGIKADVSIRNSTDQTFDERGIEIPEAYNPFHYTEQVYAAYLSYGNQWKWFGLQLGLRGEETITQANGLHRDYFELFPSAYLSFQLPKENELQLNYSRRIDRPRGRLINNYVDRSDPLNISYGNPWLLPEFSNNVEFNYLKNWNLHTLSAGLYYSYTENLIERVQHLNAEGVMEHTYENISFSHEAGLELMAKNRLFHNYLDLTTSIDLYYYFLGACPEYGVQQQERFSWKARINAKVKIIDQLSAQITAFYKSPRIIAQGNLDHEYGLNLGLNASFLNKTLNLNFNVRDVLDSRGHTRKDTWGENFHEESAVLSSGRSYILSLSYNFGNMRPKKGKHLKAAENKIEEEMDIDF